MNSLRPFFATGNYYHVYNRGLDRRPTFTAKIEYRRALTAMGFYQYQGHTCSLGHYLSLCLSARAQYDETMQRQQKSVDIISFCLMPNHFHFLIRQEAEGGISYFMKQIQGSYTKYYNLRHNRTGALFHRRFRAVLIESEAQLLHVSRYIHLNPFTACLVNSPAGVITYPWSSMSLYANGMSSLCALDPILAQWKNPAQYSQFVLDQASYQRQLHKYLHLSME